MNRIILSLLSAGIFAATAQAQSAFHGGYVRAQEADGTVPAPVVLPADQKACYERLKRELAKRVVELSRDTYVYHWMRNSDSVPKYPQLDAQAPNFSDQVKERIRGKAAHFWDEWEDSTNMVGEGLYAATDPVITQSFCSSDTSGVMAKLTLHKGQRFVSWNVLENNLGGISGLELAPECTPLGITPRKLFSLSEPRSLRAMYQTIMKELGVEGVMYSYSALPYKNQKSCSTQPWYASAYAGYGAPSAYSAYSAMNPNQQASLLNMWLGMGRLPSQLMSPPPTPYSFPSPSPTPMPSPSARARPARRRPVYADSVAFLLINPKLVSASETRAFDRSQVIVDSPPQPKDSFETLYYKYSRFGAQDWEKVRKESPQQLRDFEAWAEKYIMSTQDIGNFIEDK